MGTYANIYIEYYNKSENKWELVNPTYLGKKINNCYRQGIVRDLLDDRGWYNTPTKKGYPDNMSKELTEILNSEDIKDYPPYNKGSITLDNFITSIENKIKNNEDTIKNMHRSDDIAICNLKIKMLSDYIINEDKSLIESIKKIDSIDYGEELETIEEYKEEIESLNYALQFCYNIAFLVEFLTDMYIWEDRYSDIRIVYNFN